VLPDMLRQFRVSACLRRRGTRKLGSRRPTLLVDAYLDGEFDPVNALAVEKRMSTDPALAAECERIDALQRLMRQHLTREAPPPGLRRRVETAIGMQRARAPLARTQYSWRCCDREDTHRAFRTRRSQVSHKMVGPGSCVSQPSPRGHPASACSISRVPCPAARAASATHR
jgi:anti-sigma factor RsiW